MSEDDAVIVSILRKHGVVVGSIWDLVNTRERYPELIPVLIELLPMLNDIGAIEGVVRALTVKETPPAAAKTLIATFRRLLGSAEPRARFVLWAVANSLTVVADKSSEAEIIELLGRPESGSARQMLALTLGRLKSQNAIPLLIELLADEEVVGHAASALGKIRAQEASLPLERLTLSSRSFVRKEAKKALERIMAEPEGSRADRKKPASKSS